MFSSHRSAQGERFALHQLISCLALLPLAAWLSGPYQPAVAQPLDLLYEEDFDHNRLSLYPNIPGQASSSPQVSTYDQQPLPPGWTSFESLENTPVRLDNLMVYSQQPKIPKFPECEGERPLLYAEDFEDGQAKGWILDDGWSVSDGLMSGKGHYSANYTGDTWNDLTLYVNFSQPPKSGWMHISLRKSGLGRYYVGVRPGSINLHKQLWQTPVQTIDFVDSRLDLKPNDPHILGFTAHGRYLKVSLDGKIHLEIYDDQPPLLDTGSIALETLEDASAKISEVWVCGRHPPPQPPPTPFQIGGSVFQDTNENGVQDSGESGISGVRVYLLDSNGQPVNDINGNPKFEITDATGMYYFNVRNGTYTVRVGNENFDPGGPLERTTSTTGNELTRTVNNANVLTYDFGYRQPPPTLFKIGDSVFQDTNENGEQDSDEPGISGVRVYLLDGNGQPVNDTNGNSSDVTNANGIYNFDLPNGTYTVGVGAENLNHGGLLEGTTSTTSNELTRTVNNANVLTYDFGYRQPPPLPDLTIESIVPNLSIEFIVPKDFSSAFISQTLPLTVTIQNIGDKASDPSEIRIQRPDGEPTIKPLKQLNPDGKITIIPDIPVSLLGSSGRFEVEVDPNNRVQESNEGNNSQVGYLIVIPPPLLLVIIIIVLCVILAILIVFILWPKPPPVHLLDLWLTEGGSGQGKRIKKHQPLVAGNEYCMHAHVVYTEAQRGRRSRTQAVPATLPLQAVVYSPTTDFAFKNRRIGLNLAPTGSSEPVFWPFRANQPGLRRARVCLYHGNLMLQSAFVDAQVVTSSPERMSTTSALRRRLDYVSSASLTDLERLPQPAISIFTNQTPDGTGWIGVYAAGDPLTGFGDGLLREVDPNRLEVRAGLIRKQLLEIEEAYNYPQPSPDSEAWADKLSRLERDLAMLACSGWSLYDELFLQAPGVTKEDKQRFDQALRQPGLVSIDRCRSERTTLPWAAIYDLEVDTGMQDQLRLCPVFREELEANWSGDPAQNSAHPDWLYNPQSCPLNPRCPLASQDEQQTLLTICPFGFWGFRHQISQPLQAVQPTPAGKIPKEIARHGKKDGGSSFDSTIFLQRRQDETLKLAIGVHQGLSFSNQLQGDVTALRPTELEVTFDSTRDGVLGLLKQGGFHLYILYCHGDRDEREQKFKLVFGPPMEERTISCENLNPLKISWPEQPKPLVVLNGCETVAVTPEMMHGLLDRLHELGAAGVVGTEIQVYPSLAYPFGLEFLNHLLCGASIGEAFLEERKELLLKFNPLGLAFTYYSPASLHLHVEGACSWCAAHKVEPKWVV